MPWAIGDKVASGTVIGMGKTSLGDLRYLVEHSNGEVAVHTNGSLLSMHKPRIVLGPRWRDGNLEL